LNYSCLLDNTDTHLLKESDTLADELALTLFLYYAKELETLADELVFTSFSHPVKDDILADELDYTTYVKPTAFRKRLGTRSKRTVFKDLRYSTRTSSQTHQSKK
jgi:hypothetical protein